MDSKKIEDEDTINNDDKAPQSGAVDTGRRVDVSNLHTPRSSQTVRRRPGGAHAAPKKPAASHDDNAEILTTSKPRTFADVARDEQLDKMPLRPEKATTLYVEPLEIDESGDFAALLGETEDNASRTPLKIGDKVTGKVVHVGKEYTFVALSPKIEAAMATIEFTDDAGNVTVRFGQKVSAYVVSTTGGVTLSNQIAHAGVDTGMLEEAAAKKVPVEGKVLSVNKGGFDVQISGKRAFCPVGQIDIKFVEDTSTFVGRTLTFIIERIEEGGRNIVVSRRALLERERKEKARELIKSLEVNKRYEAVITRVADFGAFADIGGLEGLIPRSEISHGHIERVSDAVSTGDRVEVVVLSFEIDDANPTKSRVSFSLKKTKDDPYTLHWNKIAAGATLEGRVVRIESFGAFVELFPGIDGLIHISELSENRVQHPKDILSIGDPVTVRVVSADDESKRVALSLREQVVRKKDAQAVSSVKLERGQKAAGVVSRVERYGVFVELDTGVTALLPASETDLPKTADLHRAFAIGSKLDVVIIDIDGQNRVRVSLHARKQMEERDSFLKFQTEEKTRGAGFGTFGDLLKKKK